MIDLTHMRPYHASIVAAALAAILSVAGWLVGPAQAEPPQQAPIDRARTAVESLINRLRGRDMPEGIVKTNGRIEATQVDVAAKYAGRLATVSVNEGDEVTAGQVVATISSPILCYRSNSAQRSHSANSVDRACYYFLIRRIAAHNEAKR